MQAISTFFPLFVRGTSGTRHTIAGTCRGEPRSLIVVFRAVAKASSQRHSSTSAAASPAAAAAVSASASPASATCTKSTTRTSSISVSPSLATKGCAETSASLKSGDASSRGSMAL